MKDAEESPLRSGGEPKARPKVSVVIPTYNRAHLLRACLQSITRQTYRDFEIVVVDDGSTDNTAEVVAAFAPLARYFWQENQGIPGALNRGLREARGEYVSFLASDDALVSQTLEVEVQALEANPGVGLVYGQAWQMNEKGTLTSLRKPGFAKGSYIRSGREEIRDLLFADHITCSTVMVRRRCLDDVGFFDPGYSPLGEDWDMWTRIARKYDVAYIAWPLGIYLDHAGPEGNIYAKVDPWTLERLRRRYLEQVLEDPEIGHLYQDVKAKAFARHHTLVATRAYKAREMGLARSHILRALRARPLECVGPKGLAMVWLFLKTWTPVPILESVRGVKDALRNLLPTKVRAGSGGVRHGAKRAPGFDDPQEGISPAGLGHERS
jgi:glycosyltransferase involved in cell wall biosynthesis